MTAESDLSKLLAEAAEYTARADPIETASTLAKRYDWNVVNEEEQTREAERLARLDSQLTRYVNGPLLRVALVRPNMSFDPGTVDTLDDRGQIYGIIRLTDVWGAIDVTGGALLSSDWMSVVVPAPDADLALTTISGDGYLLTLNPGWRIVPGERPGDFSIVENQQ